MKLLIILFVLLIGGCASIQDSNNATVVWTFFGDIPDRDAEEPANEDGTNEQ